MANVGTTSNGVYIASGAKEAINDDNNASTSKKELGKELYNLKNSSVNKTSYGKSSENNNETPKKVKYGAHYTTDNRKKVLKSDVCYETEEEYKYQTNEMGVIIKVEGKLQLGTAERNLYAQRKVGGKDRNKDDDGGHLIASQFLGSGEIDNLVPMNSQINRAGGKWYNLEQEWAEALEKKKDIYVKIEAFYEKGSTRPTHFKVKYNIQGKRSKTVKILNQIGG